MPNINITVREKIAHTISDTCIVCGNSDYVAVFDFDAEWDAYEVKTARFIWGGTYTDVAFTGNECPVPVILDAVSVLVGVYAGDLHTTTAAAVGVRRSILGGNHVPAKGELLGSNEIVSAISTSNKEQIQALMQIVNGGYDKVLAAIHDMFGETETVLCTVTLADIPEDKLLLKELEEPLVMTRNDYLIERITENGVTNEYGYEQYQQGIYGGKVSFVLIGRKPADGDRNNLVPFEGICINLSRIPDGITLEVVKVSVKKIPIEYVDTADVEDAIYSIADEVNDL